MEIMLGADRPRNSDGLASQFEAVTATRHWLIEYSARSAILKRRFLFAVYEIFMTMEYLGRHEFGFFQFWAEFLLTILRQ